MHNVVFGGFAPSAVADRLEISEAKALPSVLDTLQRATAQDGN